MWKSTVGGRVLHFHLAGINNQNFIMRDEETGTWWQQVSGRALFGPLAGRRLDAMAWDEVTFAVWRREHPATRVLRPVEGLEDKYAPADWETGIGGAPTVTPVDPADPLQPRDLIVGLAAGDAAVAYPWRTLADQSPIVDWVGETPVVVLLHPDGRSLRCFERRVDGAAVELFLRTDARPPSIVDDRTGSEWDFTGTAVAGPLAGRRLPPLPCLKDFWFDWKVYHPKTRVFSAGLAPRPARPGRPEPRGPLVAP